MKVDLRQRTAFCSALAILMSACFFSLCSFHSTGCYGPQITADISSTEVNINESVTVFGEICPAGENITVRVTFTRPDCARDTSYLIDVQNQYRFPLMQSLASSPVAAPKKAFETVITLAALSLAIATSIFYFQKKERLKLARFAESNSNTL